MSLSANSMGLVFSGDPGSVHAVGGREDHGRTSPRFPPTQQWAHVIHESGAAFASFEQVLLVSNLCFNRAFNAAQQKTVDEQILLNCDQMYHK
ncbi:hypothetical protein TNCT_40871 [Trichonephila clavata]|uniref:Uncharacterized protein n=1 Tax=Trichonephila clavata TaxID=2740835 RepID=A0A8X6J1Y3_TRICU|nr:hypothetical protein TNCT_40871 [Trichonephila clavata]